MSFYSCFFSRSKKIGLIFIELIVLSLISLPIYSFAQGQFPYELKSPIKKYELPEALLEVSGISLIADHTLAMVEDELGKLYLFDLNKDTVSNIYDFADHGDFEDVTIVGKTAFILRSDGTIFELQDYGSESMSLKQHSTFLTSKNDTEGLCYDSVSHSLFITCKSSPSNPHASYKGNRAVYIFDLSTYELNEKPFLLVNRARIEMRMNDDDQNFKPAGISIHPKSGDIYMVAASGQLLVVTNREGKLKWIKKLKKKVFSQPEGICFTQDGTMYISSEGVEGPGYVLKFTYNPE